MQYEALLCRLLFSLSMSLLEDNMGASQPVPNIQEQAKEKIRLRLESLAHLDRTGKCSAEDEWEWKAQGSYCDVYQAHLHTDGKEIKVALKKARIGMYYAGEGFGKVR